MLRFVIARSGYGQLQKHQISVAVTCVISYLARRMSYLSIGELVNTLPNSLTCRVLEVSQLTFSQIKSSHTYVVNQGSTKYNMKKL
jgi:hypothetical protein